MIDPQTLSLFQDAVADPRFPIAIGIAALSGLVRGFSGFGSALVYMPLIAAVYSPRLAAPTLLLIDTICSLPFALHAMPQCNWREVTPVTIGGVVTLPIGVLALLWIDPLSLRWVHRGFGAGRAGGAGRRLALSRPPDARRLVRRRRAEPTMR